MFRKGVPSTFANLKQLYTDPAKMEMIRDIAEKLLSEEPQTNGSVEKAETNGSADGSHKLKADPKINWLLSIYYFLAQHYDYHLSRDSTKAQHYIEKAVSLNPSPKDYTYHMTQARILKHQGSIDKAAQAMNAAREMDLKDRYINTKCAKYQLRNDENQVAVNTMGLFTRKEAVGGPLPLHFAINLSAIQIARDNVASMVEGALKAAGISGNRLTLELTESSIVQDPGRAQRVFEALKALDATVAMDDFGTGYSSLAYLQRLPIDVLKIDRSFVSGMMVDPDSVAIVRAVLSLADALGMSTTAEGVESRELATTLAALGCASGQGFFFARPLAADEALEYWRSRRRTCGNRVRA